MTTFNAYQANKYDAFFETKKGKYIYEVETRVYSTCLI